MVIRSDHPSSDPIPKATPCRAQALSRTVINESYLRLARRAPCRQGVIMPAEMLTHAGITDRFGFFSVFQSLVNRLRLPRQRRKADSARMTVDLAESPTVTARSSESDRSVVATLTARIEMLEVDFAKVEAAAATHRADFERERERCERLMAEVLKGTAELMAAREAAAKIAGELAALQARPWWRRLAG
jgi:hypothetical protein